MRKLLLSTVAVAAGLAAVPASATIIIVDASSIQGENVLFNNGVQTGPSVTGSTQNGTTILFSGSTLGGGNLIRANGGQARVEGALDASTSNPNDTLLLSSLNFGSGSSATFNNLEFNLLGGTASGVNFALTDNAGEVFNFTRALGNGENFFGFVGIDGQSIRNVSLSFTGGGVGDLRQLRLDQVGQDTPAVPEPAAWAMMIAGFGMVGGAMRRQKKVKTSVSFA